MCYYMFEGMNYLIAYILYLLYLGCLAFTLAGKKVKFHDEPAYMSHSLYKGEMMMKQ